MVITLLSDFGDLYPASMKGVILGIDPGANIVDISHSVPAQDIRAGAFMLMATARYFPSGTVHIAVVDPGVGTKRRVIAVKSAGEDSMHAFVGPDNGLLIPAAKSTGNIEVFEITNTGLFRESISGTFHGRDIFAPVGAHISAGLDIEKAGDRIYDYVEIEFGEGKEKEGSLEGNIIFIDTFGNMVTNIKGDIMDKFRYGDSFDIQGRHFIFRHSYGFCEKGEMLVLIGSHGFLEIAVNQGNAARLLNLEQGNRVVIKGSGV